MNKYLRLTNLLMSMPVGEIDSALCLTDGKTCWENISNNKIIGEAIKHYLNNKRSFALYRNPISKRGFSVLAVVQNGKYVSPFQINQEILHQAFPQQIREKLNRIHIRNYKRGIDTIF
jgi:hypothetical protein